MPRNLSRAVFCLLCAWMLVVVPAPAEAFELSGGVSVGGIQVGTAPQFAVSPFVGWLWRDEKDFRIEVHNMFSIVPGAKVGFYDRTAVTGGYAWKTGTISFGPSFSIYSTPVCGSEICNRVTGVAPGGHIQTEWYYLDPLGGAVSANLDWAGGNSRVLHGNWVVLVTVGPVWRFGREAK